MFWFLGVWFNINPVVGELMGAFIGLALWGFYVCLFITTVVVTYKKDNRHTHAMTGNILIFIFNLVETADTIYRAHLMFIVHGDSPMYWWFTQTDAGLSVILADLSFLFSGLVANAILWWRLYIIWGRDRRVFILPVMGMMAFFAGGSYILRIDVIRLRHPSEISVLVEEYIRATEVLLSFDLVITWLVTILIIWKLYHVGHRAMNLTGHKSNRYLRIILALVESGVLYSVFLGVFVALYFANMARIPTYNGTILTNLISQRSVAGLFVRSLTRVTGIVPMMIMLQLGLGYEQPADSMNRPTHAPRPSPPREQPARRPARRDSLSIDISSFHNTGIQSSSGPGDMVVVKQAQSWRKLQANPPWKTVGGWYMADSPNLLSSGELDLERGEGKRRRSSEF